MECLGTFSCIGPPTHVIGADAFAYGYGDMSRAQHELLLGQYIAYPVQTYGQYIQTKFLGQMERSLMETQNRAIGRTRTLGEHKYGIASLHQTAELRHILLNTVGGRHELCTAYQRAVDGIAPNPVIGNHDHLGSEHHKTHQVQM